MLTIDDVIPIIMPVPGMVTELTIMRITGTVGSKRYTCVYKDLYCIITDDDLLYYINTPVVVYDAIKDRFKKL